MGWDVMAAAQILFGPVPSRRLGRSLGINNIPPKVCSYSCVYCQVGRTLEHEVEPRAFYRPEDIVKQVEARIQALSSRGETADYLAFVPDGEPTLDKNLAETIESLRPFGIKIAVITNASLLWKSEVRQALQKADWVSVKIDVVDERIWRRINRPHRDLKLDTILDGMQLFAEQYSGELATETMLVKGLNDRREPMAATAHFVAAMSPDKSYLAVPTRPPADAGITPPAEEFVMDTYHLFREQISHVECLVAYEGDDFSGPGDIAEELVNITSVHPMREDAVKRLLEKKGKGFEVVDRLIRKGKITCTTYEGNRFYLRAFPQR